MNGAITTTSRKQATNDRRGFLGTWWRSPPYVSVGVAAAVRP